MARRGGTWAAAIAGFAGFTAGSLGVPSGARADDGRTVLVGAIVAPDGSIVPGRAVVVEGGRIVSVLDADGAEGARGAGGERLDFEGVLSPGLIDAGSRVGVLGPAQEGGASVNTTASAADAVDASRAALARALEAGVTAALVLPAPGTLVSGVGATARTWAGEPGTPEFIRREAALVFSLGPQALSAQREPTSRAGALAMLRDVLAGARGGADPRLAALAGGELDALVVCAAGDDVFAALRTFGEAGIVPVIAHTAEVLDVAEGLEGESSAGARAFIVGPYTFATPPEVLAGAGALSRRGVDVAFSAGMPDNDPAGLRLTASLAVRYGMDAAAARRGMTSSAAKVAGVSGRVGAIAPGLDADLVLFSADPLRPDARVEAVWVRGRRVAQSPPAPPEPPRADRGTNPRVKGGRE